MGNFLYLSGYEEPKESIIVTEALFWVEEGEKLSKQIMEIEGDIYDKYGEDVMKFAENSAKLSCPQLFKYVACVIIINKSSSITKQVNGKLVYPIKWKIQSSFRWYIQFS